MWFYVFVLCITIMGNTCEFNNTGKSSTFAAFHYHVLNRKFWNQLLETPIWQRSLGNYSEEINSYRIFNGNNVDITVHPYIVSLHVNKRHNCGGSIINPEYVLSARHCIKGSNVSHYINAGSTYAATLVSVHQVVEVKFADHSIDAALLRVYPYFQYRGTIKPIKLADVNDIFPPGTMATVMGWGRTENAKFTNHLSEVQVPIVSDQQCTEHYGNIIKEEEMCAGYDAGMKGTCFGDSGGPLVANGKQAGIVSWALKCATRKFPTVYVRISTIRQWIYDITGV